LRKGSGSFHRETGKINYKYGKKEQENGMLETLFFDEEAKKLYILDQTRLPGEERYICLERPEEFYRAIADLQVRGAPAIGMAAAYGVAAWACQDTSEDFNVFYEKFSQLKKYLASARPTAVNLFWALDRMEQVVLRNKGSSLEDRRAALCREAAAIQEEDIDACRKIGDYGKSLLWDGCGVLTHCNAGQLAASRYGTALAPLYRANEAGMSFSGIYVDETRPLLQGARLTTYELMKNGLHPTLLCDNMASSLMSMGKVDAVLVGCDRVAANGDVCNKIGTCGVAILASYYHIPFYVCAPTSTIDRACPRGDAIVIEQRAAEEVTDFWYDKKMAPEKMQVYNPAFDVTPHGLVSALITEKGILYPPFSESIGKLYKK
jgi:methylthioribose-1-phosphate isomerase